MSHKGKKSIQRKGRDEKTFSKLKLQRGERMCGTRGENHLKKTRKKKGKIMKEAHWKVISGAEK